MCSINIKIKAKYYLNVISIIHINIIAKNKISKKLHFKKLLEQIDQKALCDVFDGVEDDDISFYLSGERSEENVKYITNLVI